MEARYVVTKPSYRYYAFGGNRLREYGKSVAERVSESWEFSLYPGSVSGLQQPVGLQEFLSSQMGVPEADQRRLPLVKLLDVSGVLPVHCHPNDEQAATVSGDDPGKDEAWLILHTGPRAAVYLGFNRAVTDSEIETAVRDQQLRKLMTRITPREGDVFMIPAGLPHAAEDVLVYEVQQTSDRSSFAEGMDLMGQAMPFTQAREELKTFLAWARKKPAAPALSNARWDVDALGRAVPLAGCNHVFMEGYNLTADPFEIACGVYTAIDEPIRVFDDALTMVPRGTTFLVGPRGRIGAADPGARRARVVRSWMTSEKDRERFQAEGRYFEGA